MSECVLLLRNIASVASVATVGSERDGAAKIQSTNRDVQCVDSADEKRGAIFSRVRFSSGCRLAIHCSTARVFFRCACDCHCFSYCEVVMLCNVCARRVRTGRHTQPEIKEVTINNWRWAPYNRLAIVSLIFDRKLSNAGLRTVLIRVAKIDAPGNSSQ